MRELSIVGCGDIGRRVAGACLAQGDRVMGWVRTAVSLERLESLGIHARQVDLDNPVAQIPEVEGQWLFYFAPPPSSGRQDLRVARLIQGLQNTGSPSRVVYLSTTGVYGDCHGEWVDENRPPNPLADRAWRRLDAEDRWRAWSQATGGELVILRVAGIYGPGKLPTRRLQAGQPLVSEQDSPITNHIHSLDLVQICLAAMQRGRSGEVYNVSDGHPGSMTGYFNQVADFLGLSRPPIIAREEAQQQLSPGMLSYLRESRRLSNRKMLRELGVFLSYPTLAEGLPACLTADA
ncbi:MAG: SDR family oxidoreductase [Gammaproteobacteria bacterium]|nr:SDR family oxidoreductase [Gammaproteobacteria bacterium]